MKARHNDRFDAAMREIRQRRSDLVKVECSRDTGRVPLDNVEVVRRLFEAWNRRDYSAALALIDPEVEVEVSASGLELQGTQRGHAGLTEWMAAFWDNFDSPRAEIDEYVAYGDDVVVTAHFYDLGPARLSAAVRCGVGRCTRCAMERSCAGGTSLAGAKPSKP